MTHLAEAQGRRRRSCKVGLPPGTLVHVGEQRLQEPSIRVIQYDAGDIHEFAVESVDACPPPPQGEGVTWINIAGLHRVELLQPLESRYGLHSLVLEDIVNTEQRPKVEDYDNYLFVVLKGFRHNGDDLHTEQVSLVLCPGLVLSFEEGPPDAWDAVRQRLQNGAGRLRRQGADYLLYSLLDAVVDGYFGVLERFGEQVERLEDELIDEPTKQTLEHLHLLKRDMIVLRRTVWPVRELVGWLERGESTLVQQSTRLYLRDVYDHTIQAIEAGETLRDMLSGMLDIYLSSMSNSTNAVMKVLTIIGTIFIPLTFIAGIYGMNFRYMPELASRWGYPAVWLAMVIIAALMLLHFRRRRWL